ncbi:hypothetical protein ACFPVX_22895 [Cohnella faecalis]|uniref:Uncharacterized protein n=1 Tax=Cohnella faecalis TaxID=2315694 RepID=A0A398CSY3_9BACL|nr:hypothetical protein [Cohnella faecalis]RIE02431.1 hypothetical protein D3H35_17150 [Cohnella faecalis]
MADAVISLTDQQLGAQLTLTPFLPTNVWLEGPYDLLFTKLLVTLAAPALQNAPVSAHLNVSVGSDIPLQSFTLGGGAAVTLLCDDLSVFANRAWEASPINIADESRRTALRLVYRPDPPIKVHDDTYKVENLPSLTVNVALDGQWMRTPCTFVYPVRLDGVHNDRTFTLKWPWAGDSGAADLDLTMTGQIAGRSPTGSVKTAHASDVTVSETFQIGQTIPLTNPDGKPAGACSLAAIWLRFSKLPQSKLRLCLQITTVDEQRQTPVERPYLRFVTNLSSLPDDYIATEDGFWFRAELAAPLALDADAASRPLAITALGYGDHVPLSQGPASGPWKQPALSRDFTGVLGWKQNKDGFQWAVDAEIVYRPGEPSSFAVTVGDSAITLAVAGPNVSAGVATPIPVNGDRIVTVSSAWRGDYTYTLTLNRSFRY